jgi:hypothetical protein
MELWFFCIWIAAVNEKPQDYFNKPDQIPPDPLRYRKFFWRNHQTFVRIFVRLTQSMIRKLPGIDLTWRLLELLFRRSRSLEPEQLRLNCFASWDDCPLQKKEKYFTSICSPSQKLQLENGGTLCSKTLLKGSKFNIWWHP